MTRLIYLSVLFTFITTTLFSTHNRAGEIMVKQLDYLQYEAVIKTYTKESSVAADRDSLQICWGDGLCEWALRANTVSLGSDISYNTYISQHTYSNEGNYAISMTDYNRNAGILNINPPLSEMVPFHLETTIEARSFNNSSPIFLNHPTEMGFVGVPIYHNLAAIDVDGDSLVYELATPLSDVDVPVSNYAFPNEISPGADNNISIDPSTGTITWDAPQLQGSYNITIRVLEYRNDELLSTSIRDIQYDIELLEMIASPEHNLPTDELIIQDGETINFNFTIGENTNHELKVSALGLPFLMNNPALIDLPTDYTTTIIEGTFSWDVLAEHAASSPYHIVFRIDTKIEDKIHTEYHVVTIRVNANALRIDDIEDNLSFDIFPNPTYGDQVFIQLDESSDLPLTINIYDNWGKLIFQTYSSGKNIPVNISSLQKGSYFIQIVSDKTIGLKKLMLF